jgi:ATP synthase protein I
MGAALAVGMGIGWVLDRWLKTEPWLLVIFTAFGIAAGFRNILKVAREQSRANAADERKGRDDEQ